MTGSRRNHEPGRDPYRVPGHEAIGSGVHADAIVRLLVGQGAAYAIDDAGRCHVLDATGVLASVPIGTFADAALHDEGRTLAVASFGKGVTTLAAAAPASEVSRFVAHPSAVLACAATNDGLVVGDQAGELMLLVPERGAARADAVSVRAPVMSIASAGATLAVVTAAGEALVGTWPRGLTLGAVRGLRTKHPFCIQARPLGTGFLVVDAARVQAIEGTEVSRTSRDFDEGILACASTVDGAWLATDDGKLHHLDASLRAEPVALETAGRARGLVAVGERAAVWTTRGELVLVTPEGRSRLLASEGVLCAAEDSRNGEVVAISSRRGLALHRHARS